MLAGVEDQHMVAVPWETSCVHELDLTSTELSEDTLESVLLRMPGFTYLGLGYCEFFSDKVSVHISIITIITLTTVSCLFAKEKEEGGGEMFACV
jgi:hypothetical protein